MELKFRAWHKKHKEYWNVATILFNDQELELYGWGRVGFSEVVIEQYTGVKDKNGAEIYEGDIVELGRVVYKVKYLDAGFKLISRGAMTNLNRYCEVVGNIHDEEKV